MHINYLNFENSIIEKLEKTVRSQALITVGWLGAPEKELIKDLRQHIMVVDWSRKLSNFLKPNVKAVSAHNSMLERFDFSRTRKIFHISAVDLPFIPLNKLINIFLELKFKQDDINVVFILKDHREVVEENKSRQARGSNYFTVSNILESHLYSTFQMYNFLHDIKDNELYQRYGYDSNNADLIIASKNSIAGRNQTESRSPQRPSGYEFSIIPLKRPGSLFPDRELANAVSVSIKDMTPETESNPFR